MSRNWIAVASAEHVRMHTMAFSAVRKERT